MKTYITYLLKILSFSRNFRQFEMNNFLCWSAMVIDNISYGIRGVATNSGLGGGRFESGFFLYCKYERGIKESNLSSLC